MNYSGDDNLQYHIQCRPGDVGEYVILTGDPKRCESIASYFENSKLIADSREYVTYTGDLNGTRISVTSTGIGGPSASIALEELVQCGAKTFIRVGTCGGMDLSVKGGDLVVASGAIRMEGTTKEYAPIEYPAVGDFEVVRTLSDAAKQLGYNYHVGVCQSKDSFYGQHSPERMPVSYDLENKWNAWCKMGCLASEMETAALFIVGSYLRVRVGSILLVLANQEREKSGLDNVVFHDTNRAIETAIEAMKSLIETTRE